MVYMTTAVLNTPNENMQTLDLSVPIHQLPAWVYGLSLVLLIVPLVPYVLLHGLGQFLGNAFGLAVLPLFAVFIVVHELVHAIGWKLASGLPWSVFRFGFAWRALAPYCHSTRPMNVVAYRIGGALPGIVTGVLPLLYATLTANAELAFVSTLLVMGAVGDVYVLWSLRHVPDDALVQDHSENAGCVVYLPA
jgi:hypothetical protein